jgi:hypothetical protein
MKYEMIFGDEELFDGTPEECFCVAKNVYDDNVFYKSENLSLFWLDGGKWKPLAFMSCTPLAMRRIIKEPKRWTWEDKKAGLLPEVGAELLHESEGCVNFVGEFDFRWMLRTKEGGLYLAEKFYCSPIETPREKYDRERDECIDKLLAKIPPSPITVIPAMKIVYEELRPFTGGDHD